MADLAHGAQNDFWRPPIQVAASEAPAQSEFVEVCDRCESEFVVGSRFCHNCGALRPELTAAQRAAALSLSPVQSLLRSFNLGIASLIGFILGVTCLLAAALVGLFFTPRTVVDWQAVQLWRIEWLLASVALFVAGCLLKRRS